MPSDLQRVAQGLVECLDQIPDMVGYLQRLAVRCREMASIVADSTGSQSARTAALQLDAAAHACDEAAHYAAMAPPDARAWAEQMVSGARTVDRPTIGSKEVASSNQARRPAPFFSKIMDRLPDRPNDSGPTSGILTKSDGRGLIHVVSGTKGPGADATDLKGLNAQLDVAREHAEGHAAAIMRRAGAPREATLYLNNKPCGLDDGKRLGCHNTLEYQLPPGAKLTVYWPGGGHWVYIGKKGEPT